MQQSSDIRPTSQTLPYPITVVGTQDGPDAPTRYYVKDLETSKVLTCPSISEVRPLMFTDSQSAHMWANLVGRHRRGEDGMPVHFVLRHLHNR